MADELLSVRDLCVYYPDMLISHIFIMISDRP